MQKFLSEHSGQQEVTAANVDEMVYPANAISKKLLHLQGKNLAIEDCMQVVKKSFDKDNITLEEYLKLIRQLSSKQAKQIIKMRKLTGSMAPEQAQMPQPGMAPQQFGQPAY